ncbi:hypothetical protein B0H11DRAFT_2368790 [Mycena galericulata]|nr:hypothetical protein B0H11DRAFT_2368790 [Mycena galericulata]
MSFSPTITTRYCLGLAISVAQVVSAACLLPLFPTPKLRSSNANIDTFSTLCFDILAGVTGCFGWVAVLDLLRQKPGVHPPAGAQIHIGALCFILAIWLIETIFIVLPDPHFSSSPFWTFVSSCAKTHFISSGKCAGITLLLPVVNLLLILGTAWTIYRQARAEHPGYRKVEHPPPPPEVVAAWTVARVEDLQIGCRRPCSTNKDIEEAAS